MVIQVHVIDKKLTLSIKGICRLKVNGWGRIYQVNINQKKMEVAMLSSDRADFTARKVVRQRRVLAFVQLPSHVWLFATPLTEACRASVSLAISWSLLKLISIESVMPSNLLILCCPLLLLPSVFPSIKVFSKESALCFKWSKYWSFSLSISLSIEYSGMISSRID